MAKSNIYPPVKFPVMGRPLKYTPDELEKKFVDYVEWCRKNPIVTGSSVTNTSVDGRSYGSATQEEKPRLVSIGGFLIHIGATRRWWRELDDSKMDFSPVKDLIREFCEQYQKEMAAAGIFNGNIISRLLGLADKHEVEAEVKDYDFKFGGQ
jgi:hypothetical protein